MTFEKLVKRLKRLERPLRSSTASYMKPCAKPLLLGIFV